MKDKTYTEREVIKAVKNHNDLLGLAKQFKRYLESADKKNSIIYRQVILTIKQAEK